ncbi:putative nucleotidyltransferase with HDIG domain [Janthinobacterium sp. CG_S6]|nr:putative nucleotidyltransferase with HDIG domain [Janthinobacterium sp. CG_S6]
MNMAALSIEDIVKRIQDLPSLPVVVMELLSTMQEEDVDVHLLAGKITLDQSLTAKTLRLANSSFYGMQSKVTSIQQAIAVLGFHSIRTLVTACSVTGAIAPLPGSRFDFPGFWRHSVATAVAAKALAPRLRQNAETAFTAGLLHDLGTLVLATRFPAQYEEALAWRRAHDCGTAEAERAVFGLDHAVVGGALAAHWKFPAAIQGAVASHHELLEQDVASLPLAIHVADILAHALDLSGQEDELVPAMSARVWRTLALSDEAGLALLRETEHAFHEMSQILVG